MRNCGVSRVAAAGPTRLALQLLASVDVQTDRTVRRGWGGPEASDKGQVFAVPTKFPRHGDHRLIAGADKSKLWWPAGPWGRLY